MRPKACVTRCSNVETHSSSWMETLVGKIWSNVNPFQVGSKPLALKNSCLGEDWNFVLKPNWIALFALFMMKSNDIISLALFLLLFEMKTNLANDSGSNLSSKMSTST